VATDDQLGSGAKSVLLRIPGGRVMQTRKEMVMQAIAGLSVVLIVSLTTSTLVRAQQTDDCRSCREYQQACLKNHTRDACNNEYNICMKYCRKK
jgi:hypothetical protein